MRTGATKEEMFVFQIAWEFKAGAVSAQKKYSLSITKMCSLVAVVGTDAEAPPAHTRARPKRYTAATSLTIKKNTI